MDHENRVKNIRHVPKEQEITRYGNDKNQFLGQISPNYLLIMSSITFSLRVLRKKLRFCTEQTWGTTTQEFPGIKRLYK